MKRISVVMVALFMQTTLYNSSLSAQRAPSADIVINSESAMNQLNESPERYVGKTVRIQGAWITRDEIQRDADERIYSMEFHHGNAYSATKSSKYGSFLGLYSVSDKLGGWTVSDDDAIAIKSKLEKLEAYHGEGSYFKVDLYFLMEYREPKSSTTKTLFKDKKFVVGDLRWVSFR